MDMRALKRQKLTEDEQPPPPPPEGEKDENMLTENQKMAMRQALQNPLLVHKIIGYLAFLELKFCRGVSLTWRSIATEYILKFNHPYIQFQWTLPPRRLKRRTFPPHRISHFQFTDKTMGRPLRSLVQILKETVNFPCSDFGFVGGNFADSQVQMFFQFQGPKIKTLTIFRTYSTLKSVLLEILMELVPNLENLTIENLDFGWLPYEMGQLRLPSLKTFSWLNNPKTARQILSGSPNLQIINNFRLEDDLDLVLSTGCIPKVKEFGCPGGVSPQSILKFANGQPQPALERLTISIPPESPQVQQLSEAFSELLKRTKNSLTHLKLSRSGKTGLDIPPLTQLQILQFGYNSGHRCLPSKVNLSRVFPRVHTLDCTFLLCQQDSNWDKNFPPADSYLGSLDTVKTLKLPGNCTKFWMQNLYRLIPNFKRLVVDVKANVPGFLTHIFDLWPQLESIKIHKCGYSNGLLDSEFTGMSKEMCDKLQSCDLSQVTDIGELKIRPSICDLKGLKHLELNFGTCHNLTPMSRVSAVYGFNSMKDLIVSIRLHPTRDNEETRAFWATIVPATNIQTV